MVLDSERGIGGTLGHNLALYLFILRLLHCFSLCVQFLAGHSALGRERGHRDRGSPAGQLQRGVSGAEGLLDRYRRVLALREWG